MEKVFEKSKEKSLEENFKEACNDKDFVALVNSLKISKKNAYNMTSKLENTVSESHNCEKCLGLGNCLNAFKGHVSMPKKNEDKVYFTYVPCKYMIQKEEKLNAKERESSFNERARMRDVQTDDKKRVKVIKWLIEFIEQYDYNKSMKGLYLYGNFGCGKTFLINALFNELKDIKQVESEIVYFPELLRFLKEDWETYEKKMKRYEEVDLLCIDDIGAEKVNEWSRDEVLGTILQARMNHNRTTFFTSNLSLEQLEAHLKSGIKTMELEESLKARRIVERIKHLTVPMEMISENKRK